MHARLAPMLVLTLAACKGVAQEDFIVDWEEGFCASYVTCATDEMLLSVGERECHEFLRADTYPSPPDCRYDGEAAELCLEELESAGCADADPELPEACAEVYSGCPYPRLPVVGSNRRI